MTKLISFIRSITKKENDNESKENKKEIKKQAKENIKNKGQIIY